MVLLLLTIIAFIGSLLSPDRTYNGYVIEYSIAPLLLAAPALLQGGLGAFQGIKGMFDASRNRAPDRSLLTKNITNIENVARGAKAREDEAQFAARQGFTPAEAQAMRSNLNQNMATGMGQLRAIGGNPGAMASNVATLGRQQNQSLLDMGAQDAALQRQNKMYANQLGDIYDTRQSNVNIPRQALYNDQLNTFQQGAMSSNANIGAGIQNLAGAFGIGTDILGRRQADLQEQALMSAYQRAMRPEALFGYGDSLPTPRDFMQGQVQQDAMRRTGGMQPDAPTSSPYGSTVPFSGTPAFTAPPTQFPNSPFMPPQPINAPMPYGSAPAVSGIEASVMDKVNRGALNELTLDEFNFIQQLMQSGGSGVTPIGMRF